MIITAHQKENEKTYPYSKEEKYLKNITKNFFKLKFLDLSDTDIFFC